MTKAEKWLKENSPIKYKESNSPCWVVSVMESFADQQNKALLKEVEELKEENKEVLLEHALDKEGLEKQIQQNKDLLKENSKLVQTVAEWSALAIDRKQDLDASLKEVKELKDEKTNSVSAEKHNRIIREQEERLDELITNLKQQLEESKKENERFDEYIDYYKNSTETTPHSFEVWKENY